jgi:hypothetical protein
VISLSRDPVGVVPLATACVDNNTVLKYVLFHQGAQGVCGGLIIALGEEGGTVSDCLLTVAASAMSRRQGEVAAPTAVKAMGLCAVTQ